MAGWLELGFTTSPSPPPLPFPEWFPAWRSFMQTCLINHCIPGASQSYLLGKYHSTQGQGMSQWSLWGVISTVRLTWKSASLQKLFTLPEFKSWIAAVADRAAFAGRKDQSQPGLHPLLAMATGPRVMWEPPAWELGVWIVNSPKIATMRISRTRTRCISQVWAHSQPGNLLPETSLKAAACVYLTWVVLRKILVVSVVYASISWNPTPKTPSKTPRIS